MLNTLPGGGELRDTFCVDNNGHNKGKGYISSSGELHLWTAEDEGRKS
jgi:hypothetical protein